jgi:1-acyl-sn-glycerol-3-phosphate acyltransferase
MITSEIMRSVLTVLATCIASIVFAPIVMVARLFKVPDRHGSIYERSMRGWAKTVLFAAGAKVRVHGAEHMAQDAGAVYVSNHVSWFDVFAVAAVLPRCSFVAKQELRRLPLFGRGADAVGIVFLDRDNRKSAVESIKGAAPAVRAGKSIVACPEGTRGFDYRLRPFKKGAFVLAIGAQAQVIPVVVHGAHEVMPRDTFRVRAGTIDVHILPPISTTGMDYDDRATLMGTVWHRMADVLRTVYGVDSTPRSGAGAAESE